MSSMTSFTIHNVFILTTIVWWLFPCTSSSFVPANETDTDVNCLKSIKDSVQDPNDYLSATWDFNNNTEGFICKFAGVECWNPDENRVLNIELSNMGLKGPFPRGLENCKSMQGLNLSSNEFSGPIPSDISRLMPFMTSLDLSSNNFSGEIPRDIANFTYLNLIKLDQNKFVGSIPPELGFNPRLKTFSVANNLLKGPVPTFLSFNISIESLANNNGLCGFPLAPCHQDTSREFYSSFKIGFVVGYAVFAVSVTVFYISKFLPLESVRSGCSMVTIGTMVILILRGRKDKHEEVDQAATSEIMEICNVERTEISRLEKFATRFSYKVISEATNSFSARNLIGVGETGLIFKATMRNGLVLAVKKLKQSHFLEDRITRELKILGTLRHPNLLPLLGFCITSKERLLIYKFMQNGSLYDWLNLNHTEGSQCQAKGPEWPVRVKIAVGLARGLVWLHQEKDFIIIHLNLSSKAVLLDHNLEPRLSKFTEAIIISPKDKHQTNAAYTYGNVWQMDFVKEDVYSFGVVLLELITGRDPTKPTNLVNKSDGRVVPSEWISQLLSNSSSTCEVINKFLVGRGFDVVIIPFLQIALDCIRPIPESRPTMLQVYNQLKYLGGRHGLIDDPDKQIQYEISTASCSDDNDIRSAD